MAETLRTLSILCFVLAGVCLIVALVLWFLFKIPSVIGDLTGRTARKSIAQMRKANEKSGKAPRGRTADAARKPQPGNTPPSKTTGSQSKNAAHDRPETGLLTENQTSGSMCEETSLLRDAAAAPDGEETTLLAEEEETAPLAAPGGKRSENSSGTKLTMLDEVLLLCTDETIESLEN